MMITMYYIVLLETWGDSKAIKNLPDDHNNKQAVLPWQPYCGHFHTELKRDFFFLSDPIVALPCQKYQFHSVWNASNGFQEPKILFFGPFRLLQIHWNLLGWFRKKIEFLLRCKKMWLFFSSRWPFSSFYFWIKERKFISPCLNLSPHSPYQQDHLRMNNSIRSNNHLRCIDLFRSMII